MAKRKPTQLDIDSSAAIACGMSYGRYMAMKQRVSDLPVSVTVPEGIRYECAHCGKVFYRYDNYPAKYCSPECKDAHNYAQRVMRKNAATA